MSGPRRTAPRRVFAAGLAACASLGSGCGGRGAAGGGPTPQAEAAGSEGENSNAGAGARRVADAGAAGASGSGGRALRADPDVSALGVRWIGRVDTSTAGRVRLAWSGTGFEARVAGGTLAVELTAASRLVFRAFVDGAAQAAFVVTPGTRRYPVASNLEGGEHTVRLVRETEGKEGTASITGIDVSGGALLSPPPAPGRLVELIGDSITCGYGNLGADATCGFTVDTESYTSTYGFLATQAVGAEASAVAASGRGVFQNYEGTRTDTLPVVYDRVLTAEPALAWRGRAPDVVVLNLGTNDFARGDPGAPFDNAYEAFVLRLRATHPRAHLLLTAGPMLGGGALAHLLSTVETVVATMKAAGDPRVSSLEFAPQTEGELGCDHHPNARKHLTMSHDLERALRSALGW